MTHQAFMSDVFPTLDPEKQYLYVERIGILMDSSDPVVPDEIHEIARKQILPDLVAGCLNFAHKVGF